MQSHSPTSSPRAPTLPGLPLVDTLGALASGLCAVHCLLTPLLVSFAPLFAHLLPGEERTHRTLAVIATLLGTLALLQGYRRHRRRLVPALLLGGLLCIGGTALFGDHLPNHTAELLITVLGSLALITAHRLNHTFCRACRTCTPQA